MKLIKTTHKVLSIERQDNKYNKYLKWVLKHVLVGLRSEDDKRLVPIKERQEIESWYRTKKEAEERAEFYSKNYYYDGRWYSIKN